MRDDELDPVRALLPDLQLTAGETLNTGERSVVRRVSARTPDGAERSLIVKEYVADDAGWACESAALASVPGAVRVPEVLAVGASPQIVVMEDLGAGASVADALLGDDPVAAGDAVVGWAEALADLHVATRGSEQAFRTALRDRAGTDDLADASMGSRLREAKRMLDRDCGALGVPLPTGALDQLTGLIGRLGGSGTAALTPGDTCPDNNVRIGERCVLIDFEGAQWQHLAWDVAYLRVPWPTCWCSWDLPAEVVERASAAHRRIAVSAFPEVTDTAFDRDVDAATVGWALVSVAFSLEHALATPVELNQEIYAPNRSPSRRARIMHRLARAATSTELPALAELAGGLRGALHERWGDAALEVAPAFRGTP